MDLYSFIANIKFNEGDSFHGVVDVIFTRDGARGLKGFLDLIIRVGLVSELFVAAFASANKTFKGLID
jgi:hypothetical protein